MEDRKGQKKKKGVLNEIKNEQERTNGRRLGLTGIEGVEMSIWRKGGRWVVRGEEEGDLGEESR